MARINMRLAIVVTTVLLTAGTTTMWLTGSSGLQKQRMADGSILVLNRVSFGETNQFIHGSRLEKMLKRVIPAKGLQIAKFRLSSPTLRTFITPPGKTQFVVEFELTGTNLADHSLVKPASYRPLRCLVWGEAGIEYAHEFWADRFESHVDGYFGYVVATRFPRDTGWLWLRVERRSNSAQGGPWNTLAQFKIQNRSRSAIKPWVSDPFPVRRTVGGIEVVLKELTVVTQAYNLGDIWNHSVTTVFEVKSNGVALPNWGAPYVAVADASGNWDYLLRSHRALDPRFVWRLEADLEPESDFLPASLATVGLSAQPFSVTTNILNVPVTVFWDGSWVNVNMPTNRSDLALKFVCVEDDEGNQCAQGSGNWGRHHFRRGSFLFRKAGVLTTSVSPTKLTFAVVPNVHATFFAQPRFANDRVK